METTQAYKEGSMTWTHMVDRSPYLPPLDLLRPPAIPRGGTGRPRGALHALSALLHDGAERCQERYVR